MNPYRILVLEIEQFDSWQQPWRFCEAISTSPCLDINARETLKSVWASAVESSTWLMSEDLADGCSRVDARLKLDFPWLSEEARRQLLKGASFQWR